MVALVQSISSALVLMNHGFSHHKATFQLTSTGEQNTLIDVMISYESETKEECHQIHHHQHYFYQEHGKLLDA
uniref:Uncharacterized protein n=1 Tax=Salix viminalis TaxID=40686 RepID=A0A6N2N919_SALVM